MLLRGQAVGNAVHKHSTGRGVGSLAVPWRPQPPLVQQTNNKRLLHIVARSSEGPDPEQYVGKLREKFLQQEAPPASPPAAADASPPSPLSSPETESEGPRASTQASGQNAPLSTPPPSQQQQQAQQQASAAATSSSPPQQQVQQQQPKRRRGRPSRASRGGEGQRQEQQPVDLNPYTLGRQARKAFDEVWSQVSNLAAPTKSSSAYLDDDLLEPSRAVEFEAPQAAYTTVLVVGATGRVGRILVRKLLLRGYKVKALVRRREGKERDELQAIPSAVEIVEGDIGDMDCCQEAVRNVNKIIFCAAARTPITADLLRVDDRGVVNIAKAMQDEFVRQEFRKRLQEAKNHPEMMRNQKALRRTYSRVSKREIADFSQAYHQLRWNVVFCGTPEDLMRQKQGQMPDKFTAKSKADVFINEEENLAFQGSLIQRNAFAEIGAPVEQKLPGGDPRTANTEGLTLRLRGDGNIYTCILTTDDGRYYARFPTRVNAYSSVRLPYNAFRAAQQGQPPLNSETVKHIAIRYEARRPPAVAAARAAKGLPVEPTGSSLARFDLEIDWIKALPSGEEPDFVLVSCAGRAARVGMSELDVERMVRAKRSGEDHLRMSGLGYTVVRPGLLVDEPGGYKALVFDQSDRITEPISAADVADICLRALHETSARNKTFDVCYEAGSLGEDDSMFELVVSAPDNTKTASYLKRATGELVKNT
ncbi:hypothetical protein DUNSADRAFT_13233 [Dunaliella salina]|uniref:Uncharacterized protein n=1 Tax=Dunaliella salina TaxID=3046 RepID=A0ABQ7H3E3_DUNSA|nr:hypothetical protein DUNSADRAFT_13233 [Dunaliella salina]|eukprot:KAF5841365.1 hypothetical protein DUNSADRAFT_13233 [Dunaliella salina]